MRIVSIIIGICLVSTSVSAAVFGDLGFGFTAGGGDFVTVGTGAGTHKEIVMATGLYVGGDIGFKIGNFGFGAVAFMHFESSKLTYQPANASILSSSAYGLTHRRYGVGPTVQFFIPGTEFRIIGEYLPTVENTISWVEEKSENPFRKDDALSGWGWGGGIGYVIRERIFLNAIYRSVTFKKVSLSGVTSDISGSSFDKGSAGAMFIGGAYSFE